MICPCCFNKMNIVNGEFVCEDCGCNIYEDCFSVYVDTKDLPEFSNYINKLYKDEPLVSCIKSNIYTCELYVIVGDLDTIYNYNDMTKEDIISSINEELKEIKTI